MNKRIIAFRRQLAVNQVVSIGRQLRAAEADPASEYIEIERLEQRRRTLLDYIRRTA